MTHTVALYWSDSWTFRNRGEEKIVASSDTCGYRETLEVSLVVSRKNEETLRRAGEDTNFVKHFS